MTRPVWITKAGVLDLGNVPGLPADPIYYDFKLDAYNPGGGDLIYTFQSGELPKGMQVSRDGYIRGVPTVKNPLSSDSTEDYKFTVRVKNVDNAVADRTFTIVVGNVTPPYVVSDEFLGNYFDGTKLFIQLEATDDNPDAVLNWKLTDGNLPPGITLSSSGVISGLLYPQAAISIEGLGGVYDAVSDVDPNLHLPYDYLGYDIAGRGKNLNYSFKISVTDGVNIVEKSYRIGIINKGSFSADSSEIYTDNNFNTVDVSYDNRYVPLIITDPATIPVVRAGTHFAFKFDAVDFDGDTLEWAITSSDDSGFDQFGTVGFDSLYFDQGILSVPTGIGIDPVTGWIYGNLADQAESEKIYNFNVYAYKASDPTFISEPAICYLKVLSNSINIITWESPSNLGTIINGAVSHLKVSATNSLGKSLTYSLVSDSRLRLPQGLQLLENGLISGRCTFEHFSLDGGTTTFDKGTTSFDNEYVFTVRAIATGINPQELIGDGSTRFFELNQVIDPALLVVKINGVTQRNINDFYITDTLNESGISISAITFVNIPANGDIISADFVSVQSEKTFSISVNNINTKPYENLWLKALPTIDQRDTFLSIVNNTDIFPDELIYRPEDTWFGRAQTLKLLFMAGIDPSSLSEYISAIDLNHYNKNIDFSNIKTAEAVDENLNPLYEVVYVDVQDENSGVSASINLSNQNYFDSDDQYQTVYPNSFENMRDQIANNIGYANRGILPEWMTTVQEDGRVIGFKRAVILAYTVPGASKLIAYRLKNNGITFSNIPFTADRYQLDNILSTNFNTSIDRYLTSKETVFDYLSISDSQGGSIDYAVTVPFSQINNRTKEFITELGGIDGIQGYQDGDTLVFAKQENFGSDVIDNSEFNQNYDGWWRSIDQFDNDTFDNFDFDPFTVISGYSERANGTIDGVVSSTAINGTTLEINNFANVANIYSGMRVSSGGSLAINTFVSNISGTTVTLTSELIDVVNSGDKITFSPINERGGIWTIRITNDIVSLDFTQEILPGQRVKVDNGNSFRSTTLLYDPVIRSNQTVPSYSVSSDIVNTSNQKTIFDGNGTRFFDYRDSYNEPEQGDKYIKFPQIGVFT